MSVIDVTGVDVGKLGSAVTKRLSTPMQRALVISPAGLVWAPRTSTMEALARRGLATVDWRHTNLGLAVRAVLVATCSEWLPVDEAEVDAANGRLAWAAAILDAAGWTS